MLSDCKLYDFVGIGIGPSNLGLAALAYKLKSQLSCIFFDKKNKFEWHPGMMLNTSVLQVHYLKDLVTQIDPTSPFTFSSYLVAAGRFFQFINRKTNDVSRKEFEQYYCWVANCLDSLSFSNCIQQVDFDGNFFIVSSDKKKVITKKIVCGVGQVPFIPSNFSDLIGDNFFHNIGYLEKVKNNKLSKKTIVIIGGGQSGAEIFYDLISRPFEEMPKKIYWLSRRPNFQPVEDSCFNREIFTPFYNVYFKSCTEFSKRLFLKELHLSGDGIEPDLLDNIYRRLYDMRYLHANKIQIELLPAHEVSSIEEDNGKYFITAKDILKIKNIHIKSDLVICATGFNFKIPNCLENIIKTSDIGMISDDFSITPVGKNECKIYIQNGAKKVYGLADPYLSTSGWRNAVIINSILGYKHYNTCLNQPFLSWSKSIQQEIENFSQLEGCI